RWRAGREGVGRQDGTRVEDGTAVVRSCECGCGGGEPEEHAGRHEQAELHAFLLSDRPRCWTLRRCHSHGGRWVTGWQGLRLGAVTACPELAQGCGICARRSKCARSASVSWLCCSSA